jgi:hypothetical protein
MSYLITLVLFNNNQLEVSHILIGIHSQYSEGKNMVLNTGNQNNLFELQSTLLKPPLKWAGGKRWF